MKIIRAFFFIVFLISYESSFLDNCTLVGLQRDWDSSVAHTLRDGVGVPRKYLYNLYFMKNMMHNLQQCSLFSGYA